MRLKDLVPRSLYWRSLLIVILPVALMQIVVTWAFFNDHWDAVSRRLATAVAGDVALIAARYEAAPTPETFSALKEEAEAHLRLSVAFQPGASLPDADRRSAFAAIDRTLRRSLSEALDTPFWFDTTRYPDYVDIRVVAPGGVLRFLAYRDRVYASTAGLFLFWVVVATGLLLTIAVVFIRNQVRPIAALADAAERFGKGGEAVDFKPAGAREVRQAAAAFLDMRARIQRHIEQRTQLLAGVSHDLRTPLTRLKLQLALIPASQDVAEAKADLDVMESMLDEYLAFARGQWVEEPEAADLGAIAQTAVDDARRAGASIEFAALGELGAVVRPGAIRRVVGNLIDNAIGHGQAVRVLAVRRGRSILIEVEDDGPGIPPDKIEDALKPFVRLDAARSQNRKGVGLGLAIARDLARSHGGDLTLDRSALGGLRATLRLPAGAA
jgi:two-component system osmolarity sensor histidine kinase EnvZ